MPGAAAFAQKGRSGGTVSKTSVNKHRRQVFWKRREWMPSSCYLWFLRTYLFSHVLNIISINSLFKKSSETFFYTWKMKANRHDYDTIFSVCVLYAAHGIFITIKDVYVYKLCGVIKHTKNACLPIIESKSTIDHNQKLLQALDDGLRWVLSKNINCIHFQMWLDANCTSIYISRCFLVKHYI